MTSTPAPTSHSSSERITPAGWRVVLLASLGGALEFDDCVSFGGVARVLGAASRSAPKDC